MSGGSYQGTAVPPVGGISYHGYAAPANWQDPAVTGQDLMVHRDVLRQVASQISALAGELQGVVSAWQGQASATAGAAGAWPEAQQLAAVIARSGSGFGQYSGDLREAHSDTATRITISAERYDATEQANVSLANASHDPSAIIVESGGNNVPVDPGYGKNWTPQQREAYARTQRLIGMNGGGEVWNGTFPISAAAGFQQAGTAGYTWQQVQGMLAGTDPGAISSAGAAYGQLAGKLTDVASKVASLGQTLAGSWGGTTAVNAVSQVQQLYQTAADMQANAWQAQQALTWYGSVLSAFRANLPQPATAHPADVAAANQAAQQRMAALNGHIQTAYYALPGSAPPPGGVPPPAGAPPPASQLAGSGPGGVPLPGSPGGPGGPGTGGGAPGEGTVPGRSAIPPGEDTVPGGTGIPGGGRLGALPGEDPVPAGAVPGEPGAPGDPVGLAADGEAGAGNAMEGGMFPMAGSAGGGTGAGGAGRARQSWTTEDDGTWGPDGGLNGAGDAGDSFLMPVGPGGNGRARERDRARQAWLAEDDDLWGAREPAVPPVIGR